MKKIIICSNILVLSLLAAGNALAAPESGFGLNLGTSSHRMDGTMMAGGTTYSYSSSGGINIGMDYQFAVSDHFSINPIFMISSGESLSSTTQAGTVFSGAQPPDSAGHGILALQLRYWMGDVFIGGHVGSYAEFLSNANSNTNTTTSTVGEGMGRGLVIGWEPSKSRWSLTGQIDTASIDYTNTNVKMVGTRINIGYRWK